MKGVPRLWYCDHHEILLPPGHKFPTPKYRLLREALAATGRFVFTPATFASHQTIELIHDTGYIRAFIDGTIDPKIIRRVGFPWSEGLVRRTLASVGGTLSATADALERGWGGNLAGGTHHAFRNEGAGFCVFNDIAIAVAAYRSRMRRVAIVDLDVHQGDGTAKIFEDDEDVLTVSVHGRDNFPFRKQTSRIDLALPDGTGDAEYLDTVHAVIPRVAAFAPDAIFYQSGVDGLHTDKLGRLALTHDGLRERDRAVFRLCREIGVPCVVTLGGGYSDPITATVEAHANTFGLAAELLG